jgi:hypothetical protein
MNKPLKGFIILLLIFSGMISYSQVNDAGLWLSLNLEKKITPALSFNFSEELRMNENITEAGTIFSDFGLAYKFGSRFRMSANYRFINKRRPDDTYDMRLSYYIEGTYREKINPLILLFRVRFQSRYTDVFSSPDGKIPDYYTRTKLTLKLDLDKKIRPYIFAESFFKLNDQEGIQFDNMRYCAGIEYSFSRLHMVDLFYMIQKEYNVKNPLTNFIVGIGYYFTIPDFSAIHKSN